MNCQLFIWRSDCNGDCVLRDEKKSWNLMSCARSFRSFAHFMFYSSIVCYEIHVKLIHISVHWIETIAYRVVWNEMLDAHFRFMLACLDSVKMSATFLQFDLMRMLKYDEMSLTYVSSFDFCMFQSGREILQLICISLSTCCITYENIQTWCFVCCLHAQILSRRLQRFIYLAIYDHCLHAKIWRNVEFDSRMSRSFNLFRMF